MLTKAQVKDIRSLAEHKYRKENNAYVVEGDKIAREWLQGKQKIRQIAALPQWLEQHKTLIDWHPDAEILPLAPFELEKISSLQTPNQAVLVVEMPTTSEKISDDGWILVLDKLQDPGNMGTIIRIADWYGIRHIVASPDSVDFYNPKVVQAAMGGHLRVNLHSKPLMPFLQQLTIPILAAALDGSSIYQMKSPEAAALLIGNESKGISEPVMAMATHKVTIPRRGGAESLNAAVATGIICAVVMPQ